MTAGHAQSTVQRERRAEVAALYPQIVTFPLKGAYHHEAVLIRFPFPTQKAPFRNYGTVFL